MWYLEKKAYSRSFLSRSMKGREMKGVGGWKGWQGRGLVGPVTDFDF